MRFIMQTPGGIDKDNISLARNSALHRIKSNRCGIASHILFNDRYAYPIAPYRELINRCGTESICGAEQYIFPGLLKVIGQFADGCCLSNTVNPDNEDDKWF